MKMEEVVPGQLVQLVDDESVVGKVRKMSEKKGTVAIMVGGSVRWVKVEKIEVHHG